MVGEGGEGERGSTSSRVAVEVLLAEHGGVAVEVLGGADAWRPGRGVEHGGAWGRARRRGSGRARSCSGGVECGGAPVSSAVGRGVERGGVAAGWRWLSTAASRARADFGFCKSEAGRRGGGPTCKW